jgi:protein phosphatase
MTDLDVVVLVAAAGAVAYGVNLYVRRARNDPPAPAAAVGSSPARQEAKAKVSEPKIEAAKPPLESEPRLYAGMGETLPELSEPDGSPKDLTDPPPPMDDAPSLPKLYKDEDDESLDPTRVGAFETGSGDDGDEAQGDGSTQPAPVERILHDADADGDEPSRAQSFFLLYAMAQTDKGLRRANNEDSMLVFEKASLFAVADGMGGHRGGEQASQLACKVLEEAFDRNVFDGPPYEDLPKPASELARAIDMANRRIHLESKRNKKLDGMGTTMCAARFAPHKNRVFIGHVGDSRCYRLRAGVLEQMTKDHTMAELGVTGPEGKNLARALGVFAVVPIDIVVARPMVNDLYLICSDGLTKMLSDEAIANVLRHETDLKSAAQRLVLFANGHGGKDNITVVLVRVAPPPQRQVKKTMVGIG